MSKKITICFGRCNPPTAGHGKMFAVLMKAGEHAAFISHSQDKKKNPLSYADKYSIVHAMWPHLNLIRTDDVNTPLDAIYWCQQKGYTDITFVAGSDRLQGYQDLFNQYNKKTAPNKDKALFDVNIKMQSAGERDPDSDGAEGISASKMRAFASDGDFAKFKMGMGSVGDALARKAYNATRKGMGLPMNEELTPEQANLRRKKALIWDNRLQKMVEYDSHYTQANYTDDECINTEADESELWIPSVEDGECRVELPQIEDIEKMINDLEDEGIGTEEGAISPHDLQPSQCEFKEDKVWDIIDTYLKTGEMPGGPIIVTDDGYIIDGHHRWLAACNLELDEIDCVIVKFDKESLIHWLQDKDYVSFRNLDESLALRESLTEAMRGPIDSFIADLLAFMPRVKYAVLLFKKYKSEKSSDPVSRAARTAGISPRLLMDILTRKHLLECINEEFKDNGEKDDFKKKKKGKFPPKKKGEDDDDQDAEEQGDDEESEGDDGEDSDSDSKKAKARGGKDSEEDEEADGEDESSDDESDSEGDGEFGDSSDEEGEEDEGEEEPDPEDMIELKGKKPELHPEEQDLEIK